jgi:catechol 2,3-dioxygenase-like lactoylglutathione lyase family enzyme
MLTFGTVVVGVSDIARARDFYCAALDYVPRSPGDDTFIILDPRERSGPHPGIALDVSETPLQEHPRIHLDLYAEDQEAECERLIALGASRVEWDLYPEDPDFVVLADTEGNRFCVIDLHAE